MNRYNRIKQKLNALKPHYLAIDDQSKLHSGHLESPDVEETHFKITIQSALLNDESLVKKHQKIHDLLKEEFASGLHALTIKIINTGNNGNK
jgi:BolA protein